MKWMRSVLVVSILFVLSVATLFAGGNKEIPQIPPVTSGTQYLSPNGDGVQDEATLSFSVRIFVKSKEGYVPEYGLEIKDASGTVLRTIVEKEKRDIGFFAALFSGYKEFTLTRQVTWDGLQESGQPFPDGSYKLSIWVVDANGHRQESELDDFVIDTVAPSAKIAPPGSLIFSPNGDGHMDTITITHVEASEEVSWGAAMVNAAGEAVRNWAWEGVPADVVWDGLDDNGSPAAEGTYTYVLQSVDQAGNDSGEITLTGIELSRLETPIALMLSPDHISPNGDGVQDSMTIYFDRKVTEGVVAWSWSVLDAEGAVRIDSEGADEPPLELVYNGTDTSGTILPEGDYSFSYSLSYENGNRPQVQEPFTIDLTPPEVSIVVEDPVFSPDGDGRRDKARITFNADETVTWEGALLDEAGEEVLSTDSSQTSSLVVWDGRRSDGEEAPDGPYSVMASFTDRAGNTTWPSPAIFRLDTAPVSLAASATKAFSPNGDGKGDIMPVLIDSSQYTDVESWRLRLIDESGTTVQEYGGTDTLPQQMTWDGSLSDKAEYAAAPEGRYRAALTVDYLKGATAEASSDSFLLDTTPPEVNLAVTSSPFAETDEGVEGEVFITVQAKDNDGIADWSMELVDEKGEVLRAYDGAGDPSGDITWNQKTDLKAPNVDASRFSLRLSVADEGGNVATFTEPVPLDILLVKKDGKFYLSVPNVIFGAYRSELDSAGAEMLTRNNQTIDRVVGIYDRYPSYDLILEGHALNIYRGTGREAREEAILQPLTERRAATVKNALVDQGMSEEKIETQAFGGRFPNADVTDRSLWWKVRRVEFVMVPPEASPQNDQ
ncbi:T9SS type B sorting domain-containing protein [Sediminispirochaeta smaragdinae]|uniref:Outer membrane protein and related peptidoglycan-associated (Lipo)protein n=1 Tax=Sediminispirochaeta smaragdinae (strain DSM 11293 / JCM 15392 / SEBR 4228) TaxID=573413 RepID=E1R9Q9_SEDSS|nr:gliding motility-associated C-terminal domain-containing protein [Sediminispirochaeta smaragdinae]ADK83228.1 Outer membrane protein and related peptidoglycan-associated (lipo)protein [Sediminispirochaeta smaragdinae DSM 11293]